MTFADTAAKELDIRCLHLEVTHQNKPAQNLYGKVGYVPTGHMLMSKKL